MNEHKRDKAPGAPDEFEAFEEWEDEGADADQVGDEGGFAEEEAEEAEDEGFAEEPLEEGPAEGEGSEEFAEEEAPPPPRDEKPAGPSAGRRGASSEAPSPQTPQPAPSTAPVFDRAALDLAPDVPVQVVAVIGKRGVTMKELMDLRMGQVIDLKRPPDETVDVVVAGKLFARGELVEIDGKLGVKILKLVR